MPIEVKTFSKGHQLIMQFARINDITLHYQHITAPEGSPVLVFQIH